MPVSSLRYYEGAVHEKRPLLLLKADKVSGNTCFAASSVHSGLRRSRITGYISKDLLTRKQKRLWIGCTLSKIDDSIARMVDEWVALELYGIDKSRRSVNFWANRLGNRSPLPRTDRDGERVSSRM